MDVKIEIISDCFSIAGHEVCFKFTFISFDIIRESVVFQIHGGQYNKTCSKDLFLILAESIAILRCFFKFSCQI
jgi:hypothetical protein